MVFQMMVTSPRTSTSVDGGGRPLHTFDKFISNFRAIDGFIDWRTCQFPGFPRLNSVLKERMMLKLWILAAALTFAVLAPAGATGLYTCDSGPLSGWKSQEVLKKTLTDQGWKVRRIKEDGGCWEVYAINPKGERVEAYFHPVTLKNVFTSKR